MSAPHSYGMVSPRALAKMIASGTPPPPAKKTSPLALGSLPIVRTINVTDAVTEAAHEARLRQIAVKLARKQGSWMCPKCQAVRISANAETCAACASL